MPADRMAASEAISGFMAVSRRLPIRQAIDELEVIVWCTEADEREDLVRHLPL